MAWQGTAVSCSLPASARWQACQYVIQTPAARPQPKLNIADKQYHSAGGAAHLQDSLPAQLKLSVQLRLLSQLLGTCSLLFLLLWVSTAEQMQQQQHLET